MQLTVVLLFLAASPRVLTVDPFLRDVPGATGVPTTSETTKVDGLQVVQRSISSTKSPLELRDYFLAAFDKAGLYVAPEQDDIKPMLGLQITGLDTENLFSYSALLQPAGKGTTVVVAAVDLGARKELKEQIAPVVPGATSITTFEVEGSKSMTYSVDATPAEIKEFYRDTMKGAGFQESAPNIYQRGNEQFSVTISPGISVRYVMIKKDTNPNALPPAPMPALGKPAPAAPIKAPSKAAPASH